MSLVIMFYFTSPILNMFRTLIYPSSGACDFSIVSPHWSCVLVSMCVGVSVWLGWGGIRVAQLVANSEDPPMHVHWYSLRQIHCSYSGKAVFALYLIPGWMISQTWAGKADGYAVPPSVQSLCVDWNTRRWAKFPVFHNFTSLFMCELETNYATNPNFYNRFKNNEESSIHYPASDCVTFHVPRVPILTLTPAYLFACIRFLSLFLYISLRTFYVYSLLLLYRGVALTYGRWRNEGLNRAGQCIINHDQLVDTHVTLNGARKQEWEARISFQR